MSMHPDRGSSSYRKMAIRYTYETRQTKHPHSPIRRYKQRPQVSALHTCYMESCLNTACIYAASLSTLLDLPMRSLSPQTPLLHQDISQRHAIYLKQSLSSESEFSRGSTFLNLILISWFDSYFLIQLPFSDSSWVMRECCFKNPKSRILGS